MSYSGNGNSSVINTNNDNDEDIYDDPDTQDST